MNWRQSKSFGDMDEHDQPTEPSMPAFLPPSSSTIADGGMVDGDEAIPVPQPYERPFPYQDIQSPYSPYNSPSPTVYPVLPPAPIMNNGVTPVYPVGSDKPAHAIADKPKRSSFPLFVGMFFVTVQLLLLARFGLKVLALPESTTWIGFIYSVSSIFVLPFRLLLQNILPFSNMLEFYTLIAILIYGLLSRLLVRFLKALLQSN